MHRPKNRNVKALATSVLVALGLLGTSGAEAAVLSTSALNTNSNPNVGYLCIFTNLSTKVASNVTITFTNETGGESHSTSPQVVAGNSFLVGSSGGVANSLRCTASGKFTKGQARLTMQITDGGITRATAEGR